MYVFVVTLVCLVRYTNYSNVYHTDDFSNYRQPGFYKILKIFADFSREIHGHGGHEHGVRRGFFRGKLSFKKMSAGGCPRCLPPNRLILDLNGCFWPVLFDFTVATPVGLFIILPCEWPHIIGNE
jgi:hypothetical protein